MGCYASGVLDSILLHEKLDEPLPAKQFCDCIGPQARKDTSVSELNGVEAFDLLQECVGMPQRDVCVAD